MKRHNEFFQPEMVDEHIEWVVSKEKQDQSLAQTPDTLHVSSEPDERLLLNLRHLAQHDIQRLARIKERLASHIAAAPISTSPPPLQDIRERDLTQRETPVSNGWDRHPPVQDHAFAPDLETQEMPALELTRLPSRLPAQTRKTGARQLSRWAQALAAVLILGILIGGFIILRSQEMQGTHLSTSCQSSAWKQYATHSPDQADTLNAVVAVSANDAWAVGAAARLPAPGKTYNLQDFTTLIEHWDGTAWQIVPSPEGAYGNGVLSGVAAVSASDIWAVGSSSSSQGRQTLIEHWNGRQWSVLPSPNGADGNGSQALTGESELVAVAASSANDVWAIGKISNVPLIEHWDGKTWSIVPGVQVLSGALRDITVISTNDIWAVGTMETSTKWSGLIEHWDGQRWTLLPAPFTGTYFTQVNALSASDVWVLATNQPAYTALEHWDGQQWNLVPAPQISSNDGGVWSALAVITPQNIWAVGSTISDLVIAHWDGKTWQQQLQTPMDPSVAGLSPAITASSAHQIWVVGSTNGQRSPALIEERLTCS